MQTRRLSLYEALTNMSVGFLINVVLLHFCLILFVGVAPEESYKQSFGINLIFMATSTARGYVLRRMFNAIYAKADQL